MPAPDQFSDILRGTRALLWPPSSVVDAGPALLGPPSKGDEEAGGFSASQHRAGAAHRGTCTGMRHCLGVDSRCDASLWMGSMPERRGKSKTTDISPTPAASRAGSEG
eukprot:scaffold212538_cov36-Tisochrysis_lutea.AAC.1